MGSVLVFIGTEGSSHNHEKHGRFLTDMLSREADIRVEFSRDYNIMISGLEEYRTVLCYTDVGALTDDQEKGLLDHIDQGGGFFGLHTADASFRENRSYHAMLNGFFDGHSRYMDFKVTVVDPDDPITRGLTDFSVTDDLHYLKHDPSRSHHLMQAFDPATDRNHVMAYRHLHGKGRVFFFALGHDEAVMENATFQEVVRRGVRWTGKWL